MERKSTAWSTHLSRRRRRFRCLAVPSLSILIFLAGLRANLLNLGLQSCRFVIAVHFAHQRGSYLYSAPVEKFRFRVLPWEEYNNARLLVNFLEADLITL